MLFRSMILIILVAIVINSVNSYDKMEQLNQSTEEVFFAIENQEADDLVSDAYEPGEEIVVKRDEDQEAARTIEIAQSTEEEEGAGTDETEEQDLTEDDGESVSAGKEEGDLETAPKETEGKTNEEGILKENEDAASEQKEEGEQTEALSRNVTRYYEVEKGDTLHTICQKIYGDISQIEKICELNDISDPDRISPGQKIILP